MTAAAPIRKDTLDFFMSLNLPLMEVYGMSETSGLLLPLKQSFLPTSLGLLFVVVVVIIIIIAQNQNKIHRMR